MNKSVLDTSDIGTLSEALTALFFFVEQINATAALQGWKSGSYSESPTAVILKVRRDLAAKRTIESSDLIGLCQESGVSAVFSEEIIESITQFLLGPAEFSTTRGARSGGNDLTKRSGEPRFSSPVRVEFERSSRFALHEVANGVGVDLSSRANYSPNLFKKNGVRGGFCDEMLDPLLIAHAFLIEVAGVHENSSGFYIQKWLRHAFDLSMTPELKYDIPHLCERLNTIFFAAGVPTMQSVHTARAGFAGVALLIGEIAKELSSLISERNNPPHVTLRRAIGIYLFLRLVQVFRIRYYWVDQSLQNEHPALRWAMRPRECASALRPIEAGYLKTKIFGVLSSIPGLNALFRGGLLPRVDEGRTILISGAPGSGKTTFALNLLADIASQGGVGIYFSLEESYNAILDRIVTFGLNKAHKFQIVAGKEDFEKQLLRRKQSEGLIYLFTLDSEKDFSVVDVIQSLAQRLEDHEALRALVIDSINALEFSSGPDQESLRDITQRRTLLKAIVDSIDEGNFFGCIISEEGDERFGNLPYLVDTVMHIGANQQQGRWMRIDKCRSQNYQDGLHTFRMLEGRGVVIYPSLSATRSTLRRRTKNTLSEQRAIALPGKLSNDLGNIAEKSSSLIWGPPDVGKSLFLLNILTEPTASVIANEEISETNSRTDGRSHRALLVTFRTPEVKVLQAIRQRSGLQQRWQRYQPHPLLRWYSPGQHLSGDQIIAELLYYLRRSRRDGQPIERIAFAEIDAAEHVLPALKRDELFWQTLFELVTTEAVTAFFLGTGTEESKPINFLKSEVDYAFKIVSESDGAGAKQKWLELHRKPDLSPARQFRSSFVINRDGTIVST